jgi:hypothetical protein
MTRAERSHAVCELAQGARSHGVRDSAGGGMTRAERSHAVCELAQGLARTACAIRQAAA